MLLLEQLAARLIISLSFVFLALMFSTAAMILICLVWGALLLATLTWFVAKNQNVNVVTEALKHLAVAAVVIGASLATETLINVYVE